MTQAEHAAFRFAGSVGKEGTQGGSLERHHVVPIREGGAVSHPSNLYTLCFFCHREWHKFWELPAGRVTGGTVSAALLIEGLRKKPIEHLRNDCARQGVDASSDVQREQQRVDDAVNVMIAVAVVLSFALILLC